MTNIKQSWLYRLKNLRYLRWVFHPVFVFVSLQILLVALIVLWLLWYFESLEELSKLKAALGEKFFVDDFFIVILVLGIVFLGIILIGTAMLFATLVKERRLNKQQKNFLSSVSHELRSPLASMQLSLDTIDSRELTPEMQKRLLNMIASDRKRLARLVEQILVSTRLDLGKMHLEDYEKVNLCEYIGQLCRDTNYLDPNLEERLQVVCDEKLELDIPKNALALILNNLLENAIKYSPPKTPITIKVERSEDVFNFSVIDQGFGIHKKDRKNVFKMFQRSDDATKKAITGTGLGLFIVKSIVKALGGKLTLKSQGPNKGSTFTVSIPY